MDPMFLKDVEQHHGDDNYTRAIEMMKRVGPEYPQILHMFSFKIKATAQDQSDSAPGALHAGDHAGGGSDFAGPSRAHCGIHFAVEPVPVLNEVSRRGRGGTPGQHGIGSGGFERSGNIESVGRRKGAISIRAKG